MRASDLLSGTRIRPLWLLAGLVLWLLVLLMGGLLVARTSLVPTLAETTERLLVEAGLVSDRRARFIERPAPDFTLGLFDDRTFRLSEQRGKVVVVNFWASWCVPCRAEAPLLEAAYQRYRDRGVVFLGVNIQDAEEDARAFIQEFGLSYPNGPDLELSITARYGVTGIPTTFFIDREGQLRRAWMGEIREQQLTGLIEELLR